MPKPKKSFLNVFYVVRLKDIFKLALDFGVHCQAFSPKRGLITNENSHYTEVEAGMNNIDINIY